MHDNANRAFDLVVIGGGVNGCGIARDAAGRGLDVLLVEQDDLGSATSSASTKMLHGGLRYLEYYEFRLVREALIEREVLLRAMPHIARPLRLVLPHHRGLRPAWMLRIGLFIYDNLGGRKILPACSSLDFASDPAGAPLKTDYRRGFEYSDCWVDDSRLVVLNARDAAQRGATIRTRTVFEGARRQDGRWEVTIRSLPDGAPETVTARALVNAGGPWAGEILDHRIQTDTDDRVRLVKGSHVVVPKLYDHDRAYLFQRADGRVVFAIPFAGDFTLIGTTEVDYDGDPAAAACSDEEADYLCAAVSEYFRTPVARDAVVWSFAGVRPLYDDGASAATRVTRDYVLKLDDREGVPVLNILGGKLTTFRKLAETVADKLAPYVPEASGHWTAGTPLPGGDFPVDGVGALVADLHSRFAFLDQAWANRLVRAYGTEAAVLLDGAEGVADLGQDFGATLTEREVAWLMEHEWARTAEDVLWRRTKLGLRFDAAAARRLDAWMGERRV